MTTYYIYGNAYIYMYIICNTNWQTRMRRLNLRYIYTIYKYYTLSTLKGKCKEN